MLKQVFGKDQLTKVISPRDIRRWDILKNFHNVDDAADTILEYWKENDLFISSLKSHTVKNKLVFTPTRMEDSFVIKIIDRFLRQIYKIRQSDRNRIIRQLIIFLKDPGDYSILKLDIRNCYENIKFSEIINRISNDHILSPKSIKIIQNISHKLAFDYNVVGIPRGISFSSTLLELHLEKLDRKLSCLSDVIYSARYVDDIILIVPNDKIDNVEANVDTFLHEMNLKINYSNKKYYKFTCKNAFFDYLGYSIKINVNRDKHDVLLSISASKQNILKNRIIKSFCDFKHNGNIQLLKNRIEYLSMLKTVKKGKNGDILAGIAHNYQYVTDEFNCLDNIDKFLYAQLNHRRFGLNQSQKNIIKKISFRNNVKNKKVGNFSQYKTRMIMRIWANG